MTLRTRTVHLSVWNESWSVANPWPLQYC